MEEIFIHIKDDFFPAIVFSMFFVWALVMWVREGDNDEQLQNQIDGKERVMKIGDEVYVHGYVDEIRNDCIIIRNEGGYFGTITSEITADRKTEPQTEDLQDWKDRMWAEAVIEPQTDLCEHCHFKGYSDWCDTCRHAKTEPQTCEECEHWNDAEDGCADRHGCKTEPQTESLEQFRVGLEYHTDTTHFGKTKGESVTTNKIEDEPQTEHTPTRVETMSCQECKHYEVGKPCKPFLNECDCHYEPQTENE